MGMEMTQGMKTSMNDEQTTNNLHTILDSIPTAVQVIENGTIKYCNKATLNLFSSDGFEEIIGKNVNVLSPQTQQDGQRSDILFQKMISDAKSGRVEPFEWTFVTFSGILFRCEVTLTKIVYDSQPSFLITQYNIEHYIKINEESKEVKRHAEALIEENPIPLFVLDRSLKVVQTNHAFCDLTGFRKEQILLMNLKDFSVISQEGDSASSVFSSGQNGKSLVRARFPSGEKDLKCLYIPLKDMVGEISQVLECFVDVTETNRRTAQFQKSIWELNESLSAIARGDLTKPAVSYEGDPLAEIKEVQNQTLIRLRNMITEIMKKAAILEEMTRDITTSTDQIALASGEVARTSQVSADNIRMELGFVREIEGKVSDLSVSIDELASSAQDVKMMTSEVFTVGKEVLQLGNQTSSKMQVIGSISEEAVEQITRLISEANEIAKIARLIADIASQTNLLALNAAIEAARAGEAGRGFAVVAGEVKNLAGEARGATEKIGDVIQRIVQSTNVTAESIKSAHLEIQGGTENVDKTISALNGIILTVDATVNSVSEISEATDQQAESTTLVSQNILKLSSTIAENGKAITDLASLAEESSASTQEVASGASQILELAHELKQMMAQFRI